MYHRVLPRPDVMLPGELDVDSFDRQMSVLARCCNVLPLMEAVRRLRSRSLPGRTVCITFDDGYADNYTHAFPILERWRVPACFFVTSGFLDGGRMWNDTVIEAVRAAPCDRLELSGLDLGDHAVATAPQRRLAAAAIIDRLKYLPLQERGRRVEALAACIGVDLPCDLMLTREQVRRLAASGMEIGGHCVNHPILKQLDEAAARREIIEGKRQLEAIVERPLEVFAYPNGKPGEDYEAEHVRMVRDAGFACAVTTVRGVARADADPFQLPRCNAWDSSRPRFLLRLLQYRWQPDYQSIKRYAFTGQRT